LNDLYFPYPKIRTLDLLFQRELTMSRTAIYIPPPRSDGREWLVLESLFALLALLLIISGFSLYIGRAFSPPDTALPGGAIEIGTQMPTDRPLSLAEA